MIKIESLANEQFHEVCQKAHANQKTDLDKAVKAIINEPGIGQPKTGNLSGVRIYKFNMVKQPTLIAYTYEGQTITLMLLWLLRHIRITF